MKLYFAIYILGSVVSLFMTLITLVFRNKKANQDFIKRANDEISERLDLYESEKFYNANTICAINFMMSWIQVLAFIYAFFPSYLLVISFLCKFITNPLIWIYQFFGYLTNFIGYFAHKSVDIHNFFVRKYNEKHGIKEQ